MTLKSYLIMELILQSVPIKDKNFEGFDGTEETQSFLRFGLIQVILALESSSKFC